MFHKRMNDSQIDILLFGKFNSQFQKVKTIWTDN